MSDSVPALFAAAAAARTHAHAPYSGFPVGAAVRTATGRIHAGANVENAAYPVGLCAEAAAVGTMIAQGDRRIVEVLVIGGRQGDGALCSPCGACRQILSEFAGRDTPVHICGPEGLRKTVTLGELLPYSFGRECLAEPPPSESRRP